MERRIRTTRGRLAAGVIAIAVAATAFGVAAPSQASFPGTNGLIAYVQGGNVFVVNPANPVPTQVTNTADFGDAQFNAAGNKLVADNAAALVLLDPVAGSAVTVIPNTTGADNDASFDPTGTKLAFANAGVVTIDVAGTNRTTIAADGDEPDWSADGTFIAYEGPGEDSIRRVNPTGGALIVLATVGPANVTTCAADDCEDPTVSPDSKKVAYAQDDGVATNGIAEVNADGSTVTPVRLTTGTNDGPPAYSPDQTKIVFDDNINGLSTVPTDGSGVKTKVGNVGSVAATSWGKAAGAGTGTGTGTGTGASVISVTATRNGANCVFNIVATPAAAGITVDFSITNNKGVVKATGNDVTVPASPSIKAKKRGRNRVRNIALSDPKGATLGTSTATCAK